MKQSSFSYIKRTFKITNINIFIIIDLNGLKNPEIKLAVIYDLKNLTTDHQNVFT